MKSYDGDYPMVCEDKGGRLLALEGGAPNQAEQISSGFEGSAAGKRAESIERVIQFKIVPF